MSIEHFEKLGEELAAEPRRMQCSVRVIRDESYEAPSQAAVAERCNDVPAGDALFCTQLVGRGIERAVEPGSCLMVEVVAERLQLHITSIVSALRVGQRLGHRRPGGRSRGASPTSG